MIRRGTSAESSGVLEPGEDVVVELNGSVSGFTIWSMLVSIAGISIALSVPRLLDLSFVTGLLAILAVLMGAFLVLYYVVGRPVARRGAPPTESPYVALVLTDRRVILLDRVLTAEAPVLVESAPVEEVSTVRHSKGGLLTPQRLGFAIRATERREFEFPRSEPVGQFVAVFSD